MVKSLPEMQETWVQSLDWEDSLEGIPKEEKCKKAKWLSEEAL